MDEIFLFWRYPTRQLDRSNVGSLSHVSSVSLETVDKSAAWPIQCIKCRLHDCSASLGPLTTLQHDRSKCSSKSVYIFAAAT